MGLLSTVRTLVSTASEHLADHLQIHKKLNAVIDVKADFGAVGDNVTDDTTAINAAIAACPNGGVVFFPEGKYVFSAIAQITKSITLAGTGWKCGAQDPFGHANWANAALFAGTILRSTATAGTAIDLHSGGQFGLKDLMVIGPGSGTSFGVQIGNVPDAAVMGQFSNVMVSNFSLGWDLIFVEDTTFIGCRTRGCKTGFDMSDATNQNVFVNTEIQHSDTDGFVLNGASANFFAGGLIQNMTGTSGVRIVDGDLNIFENFWAESGALPLPTNLVNFIAGSGNRCKDWRISEGHTLRASGGGFHGFENCRFAGAAGSIFISGGSIHWRIWDCHNVGTVDTSAAGAGGATFLTDASARLSLPGDLRVPTGNKLYFETTGTSSALYRDAGNADTVLNAGSGNTRLTGGGFDCLTANFDPADGQTALMLRRNVAGALSLQRVSMGAADSGGAGFKVLRVVN